MLLTRLHEPGDEMTIPFGDPQLFLVLHILEEGDDPPKLRHRQCGLRFLRFVIVNRGGEDRICLLWIGAQVEDKRNRNDSEKSHATSSIVRERNMASS